MLVNVCCSGSSGSTLFSWILDNHPSIACGEELGFFSKPVFYNNYSHLKRWSFLIRKYGIASSPFFESRSILRNTELYGLQSDQVWEWVQQSNDLHELVDKFKDYILGTTGKSIWAEKTPSNIRTNSHC
jgi:hypothetical protein